MQYTLKPVSQQVIVITGASSGIGLATAHMAVEQGAAVVLAARNGEALEQVAAELRAKGGRVETIVADVADRDAAERISATAIAAFGGFDTWVNNAAAAVYAKQVEMSLDEMKRVFDIGLWGTVQGSREAVKHLRAKGGAIINVGSVLSERTMILQGTYSAMKHAVRGFTDALRMELALDRLPISVTLIKPAAMNTPYPEHARNFMDEPARVPQVVYDPRLVAKAILFSAANPKREMTVGGNGWLIAKLGVLFPSLTDKGMEAVGVQLQQIDQAPDPAKNDNLFQPREDGEIESDQDIYVRRTSLWLEAQMRPALTTAILSGLSAVAIAALSNRGDRRDRDRRQRELPLRRASRHGRRDAAE